MWISNKNGLTEPKIERNVEIEKLYKQGISYTKLAKQFDISWQRIAQIVRDKNPSSWAVIRKRIIERDKICQWTEKCNGSHDKLEVHHVDGNTCNNADDNLISLCRDCHVYFHGLEPKCPFQGREMWINL